MRRTRYGGTVGQERTLVLRHEDEGMIQYELVAMFRPVGRSDEASLSPAGALPRALRGLVARA